MHVHIPVRWLGVQRKAKNVPRFINDLYASFHFFAFFDPYNMEYSEVYFITRYIALGFLLQVVTDLRMFMRNFYSVLSAHLLQLIRALVERAAV